jgi:hypothetical protein
MKGEYPKPPMRGKYIPGKSERHSAIKVSKNAKGKVDLRQGARKAFCNQG